VRLSKNSESISTGFWLVRFLDLVRLLASLLGPRLHPSSFRLISGVRLLRVRGRSCCLVVLPWSVSFGSSSLRGASGEATSCAWHRDQVAAFRKTQGLSRSLRSAQTAPGAVVEVLPSGSKTARRLVKTDVKPVKLLPPGNHRGHGAIPGFSQIFLVSQPPAVG